MNKEFDIMDLIGCLIVGLFFGIFISAMAIQTIQVTKGIINEKCEDNLCKTTENYITKDMCNNLISRANIHGYEECNNENHICNCNKLPCNKNIEGEEFK